ncbi:hypothetical protein TorRG33x02_235280, partial [Trema orientale]
GILRPALTPLGIPRLAPAEDSPGPGTGAGMKYRDRYGGGGAIPRPRPTPFTSLKANQGFKKFLKLNSG